MCSTSFKFRDKLFWRCSVLFNCISLAEVNILSGKRFLQLANSLEKLCSTQDYQLVLLQFYIKIAHFCGWIFFFSSFCTANIHLFFLKYNLRCSLSIDLSVKNQIGWFKDLVVFNVQMLFPLGMMKMTMMGPRTL